MKHVSSKIRISLKEIEADEFYKGVVRAGSTSARINMPLHTQGCQCIVILLPESKQDAGKATT